MTTIFVTFKEPGFHYWPDAPRECSYLATLHRHLFHVRVSVRVSQVNRQVEFLKLQYYARAAFTALASNSAFGIAGNFGSRSCEMLAIELSGALVTLAYDVESVEVSEDGENGAVYTV